MASCFTVAINKNTKEVICNSNVCSKTIDNVEIHLIGIIYNCEGKNSTLDDVYDLYVKYDTNMYDHLDGACAVIVIDYKRQRIFVFTDYFNSIIPLFYAESDDEIILTTDLFLLTGKMERLSISLAAAEQFMLHGMVFGKQTLISEVSKLPAKHFLEVDIERCRIHCRRCRYTFKTETDVTIAEYGTVFRKCMEECYEKDAGMTLSGGFDTNYILHYLLQIKQERGDSESIRTYCGGGSTGKDESPLAKEISDYYGNIDLQTFKVNQDSIQYYPEIVLALQGSCFEDGIFMHYQLAKIFHEDGIKYVYTGDMADQVLNLETYQYTMSTYKRIAKLYYLGIKNAILHKTYDYYRWMFRGRYEIGALKNLKKGGLLWDYFGTKGIYPYVRKSFLNVAKSTSASGDYDKRFHRKAVLETLNPVIAQKIKRNGGNTDPIALFDEQTKKALKSEIAKMPWFKARNFVDENQQLGYELRILFIDLVRRIFVNHELKKSNIGEYPLLGDMYPALKTKID